MKKKEVGAMISNLKKNKIQIWIIKLLEIKVRG